MKEIFAKYASLLDERLTLGRRTKEDEARYTFFCAALEIGPYKPSDVSLECPHPSLGKKGEIDTMLEPQAGRPAVILEFKLDQILNKNLNKTQRAGNVFNDLARLACADFDRETDRFLVYITDHSMDGYFRNSRNNLHIFYNPGSLIFKMTEGFWSKQKVSFLKRVRSPRISFETILYFDASLSNGFSLRVYQVTRS